MVTLATCLQDDRFNFVNSGSLTFTVFHPLISCGYHPVPEPASNKIMIFDHRNSSKIRRTSGTSLIDRINRPFQPGQHRRHLRRRRRGPRCRIP